MCYRRHDAAVFLYAFDLIELNGDFDRWDMPKHHFANELRRGVDDFIPHPWHDAHAILEGLAVADVEQDARFFGVPEQDVIGERNERRALPASRAISPVAAARCRSIRCA